MERYGSIESVLRAEIVEHQQANDALQRALDAERVKVKELVANQAEYEKCTDEQITALNQGCLDYEKQIATLQAQADHTRIERNRLWGELADRQAQLAEIEQILCIESRKTTVDKVRDLHHSFKQVWNSYQSAVNKLFDTQAQLRQVEGELANERAAYKKLSGQWNKDSLDLTTLRQLVAQLPVVDGRMDVECGACYYIRSFVAGQYGVVCGLIIEQSTAMAIKTLLEYRATLAAQDAPHPTEERS